MEGCVGEHCGFCLVRQCGSGAHGWVWEAKTKDGEVVALKIPKPLQRRMSNITTDKKKKTTKAAKQDRGISARPLSEACVHATLQHENLMTGMYVAYDCKEKDSVLTATPLAKMGDLWDYIHSRAILGSRQMEARLAILFGLQCGIRHLHVNHIAHLDVKPENVFMTGDYVPKLGDFGLSERISATVIPDRMSGGTLHYQPPEYLAVYTTGILPPPAHARSRIHAFAADEWALGVVAFELFFGHHPFSSEAPSLERDRSPRARFRMLKLIVDKLGQPLPEWIHMFGSSSTTPHTRRPSLPFSSSEAEDAAAATAPPPLRRSSRRASMGRSLSSSVAEGKQARGGRRRGEEKKTSEAEWQLLMRLLGPSSTAREVCDRYSPSELAALARFFMGVFQFDPVRRRADVEGLFSDLGLPQPPGEPPTRQLLSAAEEGVVDRSTGYATLADTRASDHLNHTLSRLPRELREHIVQIWARWIRVLHPREEDKSPRGEPTAIEYLALTSLVTKRAAFEDDRAFFSLLQDVPYHVDMLEDVYRVQHEIIRDLGFNFDGRLPSPTLPSAYSSAASSSVVRSSSRGRGKSRSLSVDKKKPTRTRSAYAKSRPSGDSETRSWTQTLAAATPSRRKGSRKKKKDPSLASTDHPMDSLSTSSSSSSSSRDSLKKEEGNYYYSTRRQGRKTPVSSELEIDLSSSAASYSGRPPSSFSFLKGGSSGDYNEMKSHSNGTSRYDLRSKSSSGSGSSLSRPVLLSGGRRRTRRSVSRLPSSLLEW